MNGTPESPSGPNAAEAGGDPFRPSEYTGLLVHALRQHAAEFGRGKGLDMGVGSGVLLATLGLLGVRQLYGVDIDQQAVVASQALLRGLGLLERSRMFQGSLWEPLGDEVFDVVVANLPEFAATEPSDPDHAPFWSMGGADGRMLMDPFLSGLRAHLADNGVAFLAHNSFVGMARTQEMLARHGLASRSILSTLVLLHPQKSALLTPQVRAEHDRGALFRVGDYEFAEVQVLEIRPAGPG